MNHQAPSCLKDLMASCYPSRGLCCQATGWLVPRVSKSRMGAFSFQATSSFFSFWRHSFWFYKIRLKTLLVFIKFVVRAGLGKPEQSFSYGARCSDCWEVPMMDFNNFFSLPMCLHATTVSLSYLAEFFWLVCLLFSVLTGICPSLTLVLLEVSSYWNVIFSKRHLCDHRGLSG